jgi:putative aminopeptidase FrvX
MKMHLLKELTEARAVSGYEHEVRAIMEREMKKHHVHIMTDGLGGIFAEIQGTSSKPRIMVAAHLDEVGFMVSEITKSGYLRFTPLGGWWSQVLLSQRVQIMTENRVFTGVIGSKPPHVLTAEERNRVYPMKEMFIDVGAHSDEQVKEWGIRVGDPVVPLCPFEIMPDNDTILAKALDNRTGCWLALQMVERLKMESHPNTVIAGATVQEEVGLRGATTAPRLVKPDLAFAVDVGIAEDQPGVETENKPKMGKGPLITFLDATMVPNIRLRNYVVEVAEKNNIPYQIEIMTGGGTDAGQFHLYGKGTPSLVIGVAARYIHSHVSMVSKTDLENAARLLHEAVKGLDEQKVAEITQYL